MPDVLVVEDDRVVLAAVARLCRSEGLRADEAESVDGALAQLGRTAYRLVLVDLMLPGRSGLELLAAVDAQQAPVPPVVMVSGYATSRNALKSLQLGAFDFLPKPFDVAELLGVVRRALRWAEGGAAAAAERATAERRHFLGRHSWAALDAEGVATVGAAETFPGALGEVARVELPAAGERLAQGQRLARIEGAEESHRVWSPLSGRVVAVNAELGDAAARIDDDPFASGWLARLLPAAPESELQTLTLRCAGLDAAAKGG